MSYLSVTKQPASSSTSLGTVVGLFHERRNEVVVNKDRHAEREQVSDTMRKTHVEVDTTTTAARNLRRDTPKR